MQSTAIKKTVSKTPSLGLKRTSLLKKAVAKTTVKKKLVKKAEPTVDLLELIPEKTEGFNVHEQFILNMGNSQAGGIAVLSMEGTFPPNYQSKLPAGSSYVVETSTTGNQTNGAGCHGFMSSMHGKVNFITCQFKGWVDGGEDLGLFFARKNGIFSKVFEGGDACFFRNKKGKICGFSLGPKCLSSDKPWGLLMTFFIHTRYPTEYVASTAAFKILKNHGMDETYAFILSKHLHGTGPDQLRPSGSAWNGAHAALKEGNLSTFYNLPAELYPGATTYGGGGSEWGKKTALIDVKAMKTGDYPPPDTRIVNIDKLSPAAKATFLSNYISSTHWCFVKEGPKAAGLNLSAFPIGMYGVKGTAGSFGNAVTNIEGANIDRLVKDATDFINKRYEA